MMQAGPPSLDDEGRVTASDVLDLMAVHQRRTVLPLRLSDGRLLDFSMADGGAQSDPRDVGFTDSRAAGRTLTLLGTCRSGAMPAVRKTGAQPADQSRDLHERPCGVPDPSPDQI